MTAESFAKMLDARGAGSGKWQAHCPAHRDSSPSLSIGRGSGGRVLVRCWAGCPTQSVLAAMGLRLSDLFEGEPLTPAQIREAADRKAAREREARDRRAAHGRACETMLKLERVVNELGGRVARLPDDVIDSPIERLFHQALRKWRDSESIERKLRA